MITPPALEITQGGAPSMQEQRLRLVSFNPRRNWHPGGSRKQPLQQLR
jgi:hypothetical protein